MRFDPIYLAVKKPEDLASTGRYFTEIWRFSKEIDRLVSLIDDVSTLIDLNPSADSVPHGFQGMVTHGGIILKLDDQGQAPQWLRVEYVREGLRWETRTPNLPTTWKIERCSLHRVTPSVLATCLRSSRNKTYNAAAWNCNDVTHMIWHALTQESSDNLGRSSQSLPPQLSNEQPEDALPPQLLDEQSEDCRICMAAAKEVAFIPCGHYMTCEACAEQLRMCPVCNRDIAARQRIYAG